jgi:hypothetical protein
MTSQDETDDADDSITSQDDMDDDDDSMTAQDDMDDADESMTSQDGTDDDTAVYEPAVMVGTGVGEMPPDYYIQDLQHEKITSQDQLASGRPVFYYFFTTW